MCRYQSKIVVSLSLACLLLLSTFARAEGLGSLLDSASSLGVQGNQANSVSSELINSLTNQLGVSDSQASGGIAALVALANQQLSGEQSALLADLIPSSANSSLSSSIVNSISNMESVQQAFNALGMDSAMVAKFSSHILQYLSENDAASLVAPLRKIWSSL